MSIAICCFVNGLAFDDITTPAWSTSPQRTTDWSGARWLKATDTPQGKGALSTIIDTDITILAGNPAVIFGWTADRAYFQWQIITDATNAPMLRRCVRTFTDDPPYDEVKISGFTKQDILGKELHLRIEAIGNTVNTYLGGKKIDSYSCSRQVLAGKAGVRLQEGDEALFDNFELKMVHPNGNSRVLVSEDFSGNESLYFMDATLRDGQCHVKTTSPEYKLPTLDECYPTFYRFFDIKKSIASATLYSSALGVYDVWVNSQRVGVLADDGSMTYDEMKPGWTDYNKRVTYHAYDVTKLCQSGENSIGAVVTPGWLGSRISRSLYKFPLGMAFIAKLEIKYTDGSEEMIVTDESWSTEKYSPVLKSDIYNGECFDSRRDFPWTYKVGAMPCKPEIYDYPGIVEAQLGPTVRTVSDLILSPIKTVVYSEIKPKADYGEIIETYSTTAAGPIYLKAGETAIYDFGQNCTGVPKITVNGKRGTILHMRFGEMLNDTGERDRGNDGPAGSLYTANLRGARAELHYAVRGDGPGETYSPTTSFYGYRYCRVIATDDITIESIVTQPWSSSYQLTGNIETDNEDVNRLFKNVLWSQLSNFLSIPTDCPQRDERLGWTADAQLFATTAMYNANVGEFYRKWLCDIRDSQREDGAYSDVSPLSLVNYSSAGWADAGIVVPWQIYLMTADIEAIAEHYDSMERYMTWLSTQKADGVKYAGANPTYGDLFSQHPADKQFVSQAYYYYDATLMAKMSALLSRSDNDSYRKKALEYESLAQAIKAEIQSLYFNESGMTTSTQSGCVISLWFGLYDTECQQQGLIETLVRLIRERGYRLDTGFISTAYILQTLSDYGYDDVAYELLTQHEYPSWLYMVDNVATTMWENWYCYRPETGFCDVARNSFNHFGLGSFGSWMYSHMAGIMPCEENPGFAKVIFSPSIDMRESCSPNRKVSQAKASFQTAKGAVTAHWQMSTDGVLTYDINIPAGLKGEVHMPVASSETTVYESGHEITTSDKIQPLGYDNGRMVYSVKAGSYSFSTGNKENGIEDPLSGCTVELWPNPSRETINISCVEKILDVYVTSASGRTEKAHLIPGSTQIDVSALAPGFYMATVVTENGRHMAKFIKK